MKLIELTATQERMLEAMLRRYENAKTEHDKNLVLMAAHIFGLGYRATEENN